MNRTWIRIVAIVALMTVGAYSLQAQADKSKLSLHFPFSSQRDTNVVFAAAAKYIKGKIGIDVEFVPYDGFDSYSQKLTLQTTAGDKMDLVWTSHWSFLFQDQIAKGAFLPLDDLIPKYLPSYSKYVPNTIWDLLRYTDGKIYTVPFMEYPIRQNGFWFKKDLAEKYKLDLAAVEKDYKAMEPWLKAVKAGEKKVTPIAMDGQSSLSWVFSSFQPFVSVYGDSVVLKSAPTKVVNFWDQPGTLDMMRTVHRWYKNGYIREDAFTVQDASPEIKAKLYASGSMTVGPNAEAGFKNLNGFDVVIARFGVPEVSKESVAGSMWAVSRSSKRAADCLKVLELIDSDKTLYNLLSFGIEGTHYKKTGPNRIEKIPSSGYDPSMTWMWGNSHLAYLLPGMSDDYVESVLSDLKNAQQKLYGDFVFDTESIDTVQAAWGTIWYEVGQSIGLGIFDPDKDMVDFRAQMKNINYGQQMIEVQKQLNAYLAKKRK